MSKAKTPTSRLYFRNTKTDSQTPKVKGKQPKKENKESFESLCDIAEKALTEKGYDFSVEHHVIDNNGPEFHVGKADGCKYCARVKKSSPVEKPKVVDDPEGESVEEDAVQTEDDESNEKPSDADKEVKSKRKRGRPKGSKNKK